MGLGQPGVTAMGLMPGAPGIMSVPGLMPGAMPGMPPGEWEKLLKYALLYKDIIKPLAYMYK